jgi:hypothetical protein
LGRRSEVADEGDELTNQGVEPDMKRSKDLAEIPGQIPAVGSGERLDERSALMGVSAA